MRQELTYPIPNLAKQNVNIAPIINNYNRVGSIPGSANPALNRPSPTNRIPQAPYS